MYSIQCVSVLYVCRCVVCVCVYYSVGVCTVYSVCLCCMFVDV